MAPTDFFNRLKKLYGKGPEEEVPAISSRAAVALSIGYTLFYVIPFYLSSTTRPSPQLSRDAPSVIRARIRVVTFSCIVISLITYGTIVEKGKATPLEALRLLGYWPISPLDIVKTLALTAILFAGPLYERGIVEGGWRDWIRGHRVGEVLGSWIGWRNFVAGPITEEIAFRSALVPLHILAKVPPTQIVFVTPLYFGIAHIHHFYEYTLTHPHTPLLPALVRSLVQFAYTSIFGFFATFVYLRTGSLPAVILAHSFCNWCGLPRLGGRVEPGVPIGPPMESETKNKDRVDARSAVKVGDVRLGIAWTLVYYALLLCGAFAFYHQLWVLTSSPRGLALFSAQSKAK